MILFLIKNIFENIICEYHTYIISTLSSIQFNSFHVPNSKTPFPIIVTFMCLCAHTHPNKFTSCFSYVNVFWAVPLILGLYTWEKKIPDSPSLISHLFFVAFHLGVGPWEVSPSTLKSHLVLSSHRSCLAIVLRLHVYRICLEDPIKQQLCWSSGPYLYRDILWAFVIGVTL